jgi:iron complex transport system substrate-binding protein
MAAGNWIPELVSLANGEELLGSAGSYSRTITFDDLQRADPDVIVFMCCGYGLDKSRIETRWLTENPKWKTLQAVQNDQVYITDANHYMTRPGPRIVESLEALAQILHPKAFPPTLENIVWQKL